MRLTLPPELPRRSQGATGRIEEEEFDAVLVCSGHHWKAKWPQFKNQAAFQGRVMHAHAYKDQHGFENLNVLVVGVGNSGTMACKATAGQRSKPTRAGDSAVCTAARPQAWTFPWSSPGAPNRYSAPRPFTCPGPSARPPGPALGGTRLTFAVRVETSTPSWRCRPTFPRGRVHGFSPAKGPTACRRTMAASPGEAHTSSPPAGLARTVL